MHARLFAIGMGLLAAAAAHPAGAAPGDGFQVEQYRVELRPDLATTAITGRQSITIEATGADLAQVTFSPHALTIAEATLDGAPVHTMKEAGSTSDW